MFNIIMSSKFFKESTEAELFTVTCCVWIFQSVQTLQSLIKVLEASRGGLIDQFGWLMDADGHFDCSEVKLKVVKASDNYGVISVP